MPFKFAWLVELLQDLEGNRAKKAYTFSRLLDPDHKTIADWFQRYDHQISREGQSGLAFLSCLLPERRPDRVYNLQEKRLSQIFGRAMGLGSARAKQLNAWATGGKDDFPSCLEAVMAQAEFDEPPSEHQVTLEEVDEKLSQLAANSPYSSPELKMKANEDGAHDLLQPVLRRLQSHEGKWLARMILKDYCPVTIPERLAMKYFHFLLPDVLDVQNSLVAAISVLGSPSLRGLPSRPHKDMERALKTLIARDVVPRLGVMIKRQPYHKARSIKHCCQMAGQRQMSVERKYDGEYCQVHIDMSKDADCIIIFSKSGKESTADRFRLLGSLQRSLGLDGDGCKIKNKCILEGELLIWNRTRQMIEPFYKIRRHVLHGGRPLGTAQDSPAKLDEQLMIMFYDILLLDDKNLMNEPHRIRRQNLKGVVKCFEGIADIAERQIFEFGSRRAPDKLRKYFAHGITQRWEGFVLKGSEQPYITKSGEGSGVKLKKDYIAGLGDTADLCIVGGRLDPCVMQDLNLGTLSWTVFYLGCLENKEDVARFDTKPKFRVIDILDHHSINKNDILDLNSKGKFCQLPYNSATNELDIKLGRKDMKPPTELFKSPIVVEIMGAGFERPSNARYWTLRFPRKLAGQGAVKIHGDRSVAETTSFEELQELARQSLAVAEDAASQEDAPWIERLEQADPKSKYILHNSQSTTPGKSPVSAKAVSISPVGRRRKLPSPLVRVDTQELSPSELAARLSQSTIATTPSPSTVGSMIQQSTLQADLTPLKQSTSPKRKSQSSIATTVTPTPGSMELPTLKRKFVTESTPTKCLASMKRARFDAVYEAQPRDAHGSHLEPPLGSMENPINLEDDERASHTSAVCDSAAHEASAQPLSEVVNLSPEHVRGSTKPRRRRKHRGTPHLSPTKAGPYNARYGKPHNDPFAKAAPMSTAIFAMHGLPLPTPPASSAEQSGEVVYSHAATEGVQNPTPPASGSVADQDESKTSEKLASKFGPGIAWDTMPANDLEVEPVHFDGDNDLGVEAEPLNMLDADGAPGSPDPSNSHSDLLTNASRHVELAQTPLLLGSSLSTSDKAEDNVLYECLQNTDLAFTQSIRCFVHAVKANTGSGVLVVLTASDNAALAARDVSDVVKALETTHICVPRKTTIVFLTLDFLDPVKGRQDLSGVVDMQEWFAGAVVVSTESEKQVVRMIWDFDEAMSE